MTTDDQERTAPTADEEPKSPEDELRVRAVTRLRKRADFRTHVLVYLLVNTMLVIMWVVIGTTMFFWPIFPILGWGVGLAANAWDVYRPDPVTEDRIRREMGRLRP
ncbi:2TM domain-containing protein [Actinomycetospora lutea]|uniref:2TM domain-containing protein n=1 Tax=Actinomycetospora lutea TaxID=663604 RepID=UPI0023652B9C|nr:2TM domain-containing protein [Actinomycetospora lutea]MDD7939591.1 2TM domain-containing protein [Actinomycetospora lutea]